MRQGYEIRVFNRWSLTPVGCYSLGTEMGIKDIQVNNRVIVILLDRKLLKVLDAETLDEIQAIDATRTIPEAVNSSNHCCYLFGDFLHHTIEFEKEFSRGDFFVNVKTYQFNKSSGHFEAIQERTFPFSSYHRMYFDDRYCIFEKAKFSRGHLVRKFEVRCINTMKRIRGREFQEYYIPQEYNDGVIAVDTYEDAYGKPSVIVWDVHNNTVRPLTNHPGTLNNSFNIALINNYRMILFGDGQSEIQLTKITKKNETRAEYLSRDKYHLSYCDGVQAFRIDRSPAGLKLGVVDLIQTM